MQETKVQPRIVCAANLLKNGRIILGIRHWDNFMRDATLNLDTNELQGEVQGFVDQFGRFYTRQEAWVVAELNNQIIRRVGGDTAKGGTLYSENLY